MQQRESRFVLESCQEKAELHPMLKRKKNPPLVISAAYRTLMIQALTRFGRSVLIFTLACGLSSQAQTSLEVLEQSPDEGAPTDGTQGTVILPESVPDPFERMNRVVWNFNRGLTTAVVNPRSKRTGSSQNLSGRGLEILAGTHSILVV